MLGSIAESSGDDSYTEIIQRAVILMGSVVLAAVLKHEITEIYALNVLGLNRKDAHEFAMEMMSEGERKLVDINISEYINKTVADEKEYVRFVIEEIKNILSEKPVNRNKVEELLESITRMRERFISDEYIANLLGESMRGLVEKLELFYRLFDRRIESDGEEKFQFKATQILYNLTPSKKYNTDPDKTVMIVKYLESIGIKEGSLIVKIMMQHDDLKEIEEFAGYLIDKKDMKDAHEISRIMSGFSSLKEFKDEDRLIEELRDPLEIKVTEFLKTRPAPENIEVEMDWIDNMAEFLRTEAEDLKDADRSQLIRLLMSITRDGKEMFRTEASDFYVQLSIMLDELEDVSDIASLPSRLEMLKGLAETTIGKDNKYAFNPVQMLKIIPRFDTIEDVEAFINYLYDEGIPYLSEIIKIIAVNSDLKEIREFIKYLKNVAKVNAHFRIVENIEKYRNLPGYLREFMKKIHLLEKYAVPAGNKVGTSVKYESPSIEEPDYTGMLTGLIEELNREGYEDEVNVRQIKYIIPPSDISKPMIIQVRKGREARKKVRVQVFIRVSDKPEEIEAGKRFITGRQIKPADDIRLSFNSYEFVIPRHVFLISRSFLKTVLKQVILQSYAMNNGITDSDALRDYVNRRLDKSDKVLLQRQSGRLADFADMKRELDELIKAVSFRTELYREKIRQILIREGEGSGKINIEKEKYQDEIIKLIVNIRINEAKVLSKEIIQRLIESGDLLSILESFRDLFVVTLATEGIDTEIENLIRLSGEKEELNRLIEKIEENGYEYRNKLVSYENSAQNEQFRLNTLTANIENEVKLIFDEDVPHSIKGIKDIAVKLKRINKYYKSRKTNISKRLSVKNISEERVRELTGEKEEAERRIKISEQFISSMNTISEFRAKNKKVLEEFKSVKKQEFLRYTEDVKGMLAEIRRDGNFFFDERDVEILSSKDEILRSLDLLYELFERQMEKKGNIVYQYNNRHIVRIMRKISTNPEVKRTVPDIRNIISYLESMGIKDGSHISVIIRSAKTPEEIKNIVEYLFSKDILDGYSISQIIRGPKRLQKSLDKSGESRDGIKYILPWLMNKFGREQKSHYYARALTGRWNKSDMEKIIRLLKQYDIEGISDISEIIAKSKGYTVIGDYIDYLQEYVEYLKTKNVATGTNIGIILRSSKSREQVEEVIEFLHGKEVNIRDPSHVSRIVGSAKTPYQIKKLVEFLHEKDIFNGSHIAPIIASGKKRNEIEKLIDYLFKNDVKDGYYVSQIVASRRDIDETDKIIKFLHSKKIKDGYDLGLIISSAKSRDMIEKFVGKLIKEKKITAGLYIGLIIHSSKTFKEAMDIIDYLYSLDVTDGAHVSRIIHGPKSYIKIKEIGDYLFSIGMKRISRFSWIMRSNLELKHIKLLRSINVDLEKDELTLDGYPDMQLKASEYYYGKGINKLMNLLENEGLLPKPSRKFKTSNFKYVLVVSVDNKIKLKWRNIQKIMDSLDDVLYPVMGVSDRRAVRVRRIDRYISNADTPEELSVIKDIIDKTIGEEKFNEIMASDGDIEDIDSVIEIIRNFVEESDESAYHVGDKGTVFYEMIKRVKKLDLEENVTLLREMKIEEAARLGLEKITIPIANLYTSSKPVPADSKEHNQMLRDALESLVDDESINAMIEKIGFPDELGDPVVLHLKETDITGARDLQIFTVLNDNPRALQNEHLYMLGTVAKAPPANSYTATLQLSVFNMGTDLLRLVLKHEIIEIFAMEVLELSSQEAHQFAMDIMTEEERVFVNRSVAEYIEDILSREKQHLIEVTEKIKELETDRKGNIKEIEDCLRSIERMGERIFSDQHIDTIKQYQDISSILKALSAIIHKQIQTENGQEFQFTEYQLFKLSSYERSARSVKDFVSFIESKNIFDGHLIEQIRRFADIRSVHGYFRYLEEKHPESKGEYDSQQIKDSLKAWNDQQKRSHRLESEYYQFYYLNRIQKAFSGLELPGVTIKDLPEDISRPLIIETKRLGDVSVFITVDVNPKPVEDISGFALLNEISIGNDKGGPPSFTYVFHPSVSDMNTGQIRALIEYDINRLYNIAQGDHALTARAAALSLLSEAKQQELEKVFLDMTVFAKEKEKIAEIMEYVKENEVNADEVLERILKLKRNSVLLFTQEDIGKLKRHIKTRDMDQMLRIIYYMFDLKTGMDESREPVCSGSDIINMMIDSETLQQAKYQYKTMRIEKIEDEKKNFRSVIDNIAELEKKEPADTSGISALLEGAKRDHIRLFSDTDIGKITKVSDGMTASRLETAYELFERGLETEAGFVFQFTGSNITDIILGKDPATGEFNDAQKISDYIQFLDDNHVRIGSAIAVIMSGSRNTYDDVKMIIELLHERGVTDSSGIAWLIKGLNPDEIKALVKYAFDNKIDMRRVPWILSAPEDMDKIYEERAVMETSTDQDVYTDEYGQWDYQKSFNRIVKNVASMSRGTEMGKKVREEVRKATNRRMPRISINEFISRASAYALLASRKGMTEEEKQRMLDKHAIQIRKQDEEKGQVSKSKVTAKKEPVGKIETARKKPRKKGVHRIPEPHGMRRIPADKPVQEPEEEYVPKQKDLAAGVRGTMFEDIIHNAVAAAMNAGVVAAKEKAAKKKKDEEPGAFHVGDPAFLFKAVTQRLKKFYKDNRQTLDKGVLGQSIIWHMFRSSRAVPLINEGADYHEVLNEAIDLLKISRDKDIVSIVDDIDTDIEGLSDLNEYIGIKLKSSTDVSGKNIMIKFILNDNPDVLNFGDHFMLGTTAKIGFDNVYVTVLQLAALKMGADVLKPVIKHEILEIYAKYVLGMDNEKAHEYAYGKLSRFEQDLIREKTREYVQLMLQGEMNHLREVMEELRTLDKNDPDYKKNAAELLGTIERRGYPLFNGSQVKDILGKISDVPLHLGVLMELFDWRLEDEGPAVFRFSPYQLMQIMIRFDTPEQAKNYIEPIISAGIVDGSDINRIVMKYLDYGSTQEFLDYYKDKKESGIELKNTRWIFLDWIALKEAELDREIDTAGNLAKTIVESDMVPVGVTEEQQRISDVQELVSVLEKRKPNNIKLINRLISSITLNGDQYFSNAIVSDMLKQISKISGRLNIAQKFMHEFTQSQTAALIRYFDDPQEAVRIIDYLKNEGVDSPSHIVAILEKHRDPGQVSMFVDYLKYEKNITESQRITNIMSEYKDLEDLKPRSNVWKKGVQIYRMR
ncbi:hypothetical protein ACFLTD_02135 [Elusimicrobiota bacterium]